MRVQRCIKGFTCLWLLLCHDCCCLYYNASKAVEQRQLVHAMPRQQQAQQLGLNGHFAYSQRYNLHCAELSSCLLQLGYVYLC
jgi:hypothetical protein